MTSSSEVTAHSTVRVARELEPRASLPWMLDELAMSAPVLLRERIDTEEGAVVSAAQLERLREALLTEGYERGLADGIARGTAEGDQRVSDAASVLGAAIEGIEEKAALASGIMEENVAALAIIVARQIVAREVSVVPQIVADLVRRALTEFPVDQSLRIRVHPLDLSLLSGPTTSGVSAPITGTRDASWLADARIERGGCLIEGRDRIIDGRVDTALERAYRRMANLDVA